MFCWGDEFRQFRDKTVVSHSFCTEVCVDTVTLANPFIKLPYHKSKQMYTCITSKDFQKIEGYIPIKLV